MSTKPSSLTSDVLFSRRCFFVIRTKETAIKSENRRKAPPIAMPTIAPSDIVVTTALGSDWPAAYATGGGILMAAPISPLQPSRRRTLLVELNRSKGE